MSEMPKKPKRRWTRETVLNEIRELSDLSAKVNQRKTPSLYGAAVRHFGSWKKAVEEAGFSYSTIAKRKIPGYWNKDKVIEEIKKLPEKHSNYVRKRNADLYSAALRTFGTWEEAVRVAGYDYDQVRKGWLESDSTRLRFRNKRDEGQK